MPQSTRETILASGSKTCCILWLNGWSAQGVATYSFPCLQIGHTQLQDVSSPVSAFNLCNFVGIRFQVTFFTLQVSH
jgi:hypothetical protein